MPLQLSPDGLYLAYVATFAVAALACLASAARARRIQDRETRRGLLALLLGSGGWAGAHVGYLLAPAEPAKVAFHLAGLVVGFAAVGAWLYFCSAYTGRSLHRNPTARRAAVGVFLAAVLLKLTNPLHGLYFTTELATAPFHHLAVQYGLLHWLLMGLSYALAFVGYFMLFEMFAQVGADARPLAALAAVTGLPVVLDVVGLATPYLIDLTHEPIGVAAFSVVALFVYVERFQAIQLAGGADEPTLVLTDDGRIRDYNRSAVDLFPALEDRNAIGEALSDVLPSAAAALDPGEPVLEVERDGETRFYRASLSPFASGRTRLGRLLSFDDVTERERYRRELERQNERLEQFAGMVSHDLRNPINVAEAWVADLRADDDDERLEKVASALERMEALVHDLLALAKQGRPLGGIEPVALASMAGRCWDLVATGEAELVVEGDRTFAADPDRLQQLVENLFRNAVEHAGTGATVRVGPLDDGFYVEDDGPGIPPEDRERVFELGHSTAEDGTGFGLAIVAEVAAAHGWEIAATEGAEGGARFEVTGVTDVEAPGRAEAS